MNYRSRLREHVLSVFKEGPLSFDQVVAMAEGAYPTDVRKVLIALVSEGLVLENSGSYCVESKSEPGANSEISHLAGDRSSAVKQVSLAHSLPLSDAGRLCQVVNELLREIPREKDEKHMHLC
jgi:hypothetical protein